MIVINLNRRERKRPTADLCSAYGCGILFSLHQISPLSPESAHSAPPLPPNLPQLPPPMQVPLIPPTQNTDAPFTNRARRVKKNPASFGLKLYPDCRHCLAGSGEFTRRPCRSDRICRNETLASLRWADKRDTWSWRAGKTETILSNIDLS